MADLVEASRIVEHDLAAILDAATVQTSEVATRLAEHQDVLVADLLRQSALSDSGKAFLVSHWMLRARVYRMRAEELRQAEVVAEIDDAGCVDGETRDVLAASTYLDRHPELREEFLEVASA